MNVLAALFELVDREFILLRDDTNEWQHQITTIVPSIVMKDIGKLVDHSKSVIDFATKGESQSVSNAELKRFIQEFEKRGIDGFLTDIANLNDEEALSTLRENETFKSLSVLSKLSVRLLVFDNRKYGWIIPARLRRELLGV